MNDLISREAAIEVVSKEGCGICIQKIVDLPIEKAQQWIPCSERLPEGYGKYITCSKTGIISILIWSKGWNCCFDTKGEIVRKYEIKDIIAWQPLPEPYVEGENETD